MAAKLLGMDRAHFLLSLGEYSIPILDLPIDEPEKGIENA